MALNGSFTKTAKIALTLTAVWAVASTAGCAALYAEMEAKEDKWAQERTALSGEVAALQDRNKAQDRNVVALNIQIAGLRKSGKGLTELQTMIKAAESKLQTTTAHRKKTVIQAAAANKSLDEIRTALSDHKARIAHRRAEIEAAEARLNDLRQAAKSAEARIDDLRRAATSADARMVEAQKTLIALKTDILAREKDVRALETNLQSARTSLDDAIDRIDKARKPGS